MEISLYNSTKFASANEVKFRRVILEKKIEFIRCPRCELNFINKEDKLCSVCKKDMDSAFSDEKDLDLDTVLDLDICPICKTNYINEDEVMCASCQKEYKMDKKLNESDADEMWDDDEDDGSHCMVETEEDGLGEMVNTIDVDDETAGLDELEDLDIGIPLDDENVDFSDEYDDDDDSIDEEEEEYKDDFEDDFDYDDDYDDDFDDDDDDDEDDDDDDDDDDDYDDDDDDDKK